MFQELLNVFRAFFKNRESSKNKSKPSVVIKDNVNIKKPELKKQDIKVGNVTKNFSYPEFKSKGSPKTWRPKFTVQKLMIIELANDLQVVRDEIKRSMKITNGVRAGKRDYDRLIKLGYYPSSTSDHYCGNIVPIPRRHKKYSIFGPNYCYSVGASDVIAKNMEDVFKISIDLNKQKKTNFGQIIWEKNEKTGSEWIHYGNDPAKFLTKTICELINRTQYMTTVDGGKTYQVY